MKIFFPQLKFQRNMMKIICLLIQISKMIIEISHFLSILSTGLFFLVGSFALTTNNTSYTSNLISRTYSHAFLFLSSSFLIYIWLAITDNFSVEYIASHSNTELPIFYKVSSIWSTHEGSMFLWIIFLALWGFIFNINIIINIKILF